MVTFKYKCGYIHENFITGNVMVNVDEHAYVILAKSVHAAKILITKHFNKLKGN
jgi:hypothetical protein